MELIREALVDSIRRGLPIVGAVAGGYYTTRRSDKWGRLFMGAGGGWLAGWAVQKAVLGLFDRMAYRPLPDTPAGPVGQAQMPQGMPATEYVDPAAAVNEARAASGHAPAPGAGNMGAMPYTAPAATQASTQAAVESSYGQKGGGDGVVFHTVGAQTGQELNPQVRGTLIKDAYGTQMGI